MDLSFISHSGAAAGEANLHELHIGPHRILLDCGISSSIPRAIQNLQRPDLVLITHAHGDHAGGLLRLLEKFPDVTILATSTTRSLLPLMLTSQDAHRLQALARKITPIPFNRYFSPKHLDHIDVLAMPAGHVPGAALFALRYHRRNQPHHIVYTGDFCTHDQLTVPAAGVPQLSHVDLLISESILGADKDADRWHPNQARTSLQDLVRQRNGPLLIGVSTLGEAGEVAALCAHNESLLVEDYLQDVLTIAPGPSFDHWHNIQFAPRRRLRTHLDIGGVVLATGDQYQLHSTSALLAGPLLSNPDAHLIVLNRARKKTAAGRLLSTPQHQPISWYDRQVPLRAHVHHRRLINHAPRWQLLAFAQLLRPQHLVLVHGSTGARFAIKRALDKTDLPTHIDVPRTADTLHFHPIP